MMSSENKVNANILREEVQNKITDERPQLHVGRYVRLVELDKYCNKSDWESCFNCAPSLNLFLFTKLIF